VRDRAAAIDIHRPNASETAVREAEAAVAADWYCTEK
jgi:hypothetical protein